MGIHLTCVTDTGHSDTNTNGMCFSILREVYRGAYRKSLESSYGIDQPHFGFDMELGLGRGSQYLRNRSLEQRKENDVNFNLLFGKIMEGKIIQHKDGRSDVNNKITFLGNKCSVFEMIIATGIYRCWSDYPGFWTLWEALKPYDLHPWVRFALVSALHKGRIEVGADVDVTNIPLGNSAQHMPIPTGIFDDKVVAMGIAGKFPKAPSMSFTAREEGVLGYLGRDAFLSNRTYKEHGDTDKDYNFIKSFKGAKAHILRTESGGDYSPSKTYVNLHSFINELIIPEYGGTKQ